MRKTKNTIKINGHTYNASTGELLHAGQVVRPQPISAASHAQTAGTIIVPARESTSHIASSASLAGRKQPTMRQKAKSTTRTPQHSKTLMRSSVRKPAHAANSHDQTHIKATSKLRKTGAVIAVKKSARRIDKRRLSLAKSVSKSQKITKFNKSTAAMHTPAHRPTHHAVHPIQHHTTSTHPRRSPHPQQVHRSKTTEDILQEALHHADSHTQPAHRHHRRLTRSQQVAGFSALIVISGALLALVVSQSTPAIKMRIASAKAGFSASLPGDSPAGFHMNDLSYGAGAVAVAYKSNSDQERSFSITQKSSSWDSTTLRDAFVEKADKHFRAVEQNGLTIYLYNGNNATWVSNGVWYQVQGNGSLSDRQLVDIAKSL